MDTRPSPELIAKWRIEYAAYLDTLKEQALKEFDRTWLPDSGDDNASEHNDSKQSAAAPRRDAEEATGEVSESTNGSVAKRSKLPTMRQMISEVLPEPGETFTSGDIRTAILSKWPGAGGKHLGSRISQMLKESVDNGQLESLGKKGSRVQDPITYRVKVEDKETLLNT
jgi:hypothetical protein